MAELTLSNKGRTVKISIDSIKLKYAGPINLIRFIKINKIYGGVLYVDTEFFDDETNSTYVEEDYIDLVELLDDKKEIINSITKYTVIQG